MHPYTIVIIFFVMLLVYGIGLWQGHEIGKQDQSKEEWDRKRMLNLEKRLQD